MRKMVTVSILAVLCAAGNASAHDHHSHTTPGAAFERIKSWFEADANRIGATSRRLHTVWWQQNQVLLDHAQA